MRIAINGSEDLPWVDVFSGSNFQGRLHRLRGSRTNGAVVIARPHLPAFRSLIVGPGTTAEFVHGGNSRSTKLSARTMLTDTRRLRNGTKVQSLAVVCDRP
jgi:hypothetical protein